MKIQLNKKIGNETFQFIVDQKDAFDALTEISQLSSMPDYCPLCKGNFVQLEMNKSKSERGEFTFVYVRCKTCGAKAQVGQYKSGGIFWKKFEEYKPQATTAMPTMNEIPIVEDGEINTDEIPF